MRSRIAVVSAAIVGSLIALSASWAQMSDHRMITASDLKWADVPSLPPGAKIAVIEGPMTEAVPFTIRLKFPANYSYSGALASGRRAGDRPVRHVPHGDRR